MDKSKQKILVGWGACDITPDLSFGKKVSLRGQHYIRITSEVHDPLTATALALESSDGQEQAIIVSADLTHISDLIIQGCRDILKEKLKGFDADKLFINVTHTHTAPVLPGFPSNRVLPEPGGDVMTAEEYGKVLIEKISKIAIAAWNSRQTGGISWGKGYAVVGFNRRVSHFDGSSIMYGKTDIPDFSHIEGHEDHGVNMLFIYDTKQKLTGMIVNVPCPSQCTENGRFISADFWHETREKIRKDHGDEIFVLAQCSAAGDQSPRTLTDRAADARMLKLKGYGDDYDMARRQDIADKISFAVAEALPLASKDIRNKIKFEHTVSILDLPERTATREELKETQEEADKWKSKLEELKDADVSSVDYSNAFRNYYSNQSVIEVYHKQQRCNDTTPAEIHLLRIGDIAICTSRFEYFLDYGERIKGRCKAIQTFVVQLAGIGSYLPTERALAGGHYGASISATPIGPEGGQLIVEETVKKLNKMF